ncbi:hypothetical protein [Pelomonas sp. SE-A7]|uniref:hypothetical protein n=1 Tax=Pelomonas sp. SE-A7 TaxID=3054953 RepID=UPI00259C923A|nr:hypothetical protein [Pelomonas sp. SE-A7]MDM4768100.1 hypothetical protein [Pelomonas sp. SE-A7]
MRFAFNHRPRPAAGPPSGATLVPEQRLGVWVLRRALHASAAGQWYRAEHALARGQRAALIVFENAADAAALMLRFADGASDLAKLQHHGMVTPVDSGVTPHGKPFLVLPLVEARPLLSLTERLGVRERLALLLQLCDALAHAHSEGFMLTELDPSLLWVGVDGRLQLMGLHLSHEDIPVPPHPALLAYASPERRQGGAVSPSSEAYALGALLCELVHERLPDHHEAGPEHDSVATRWPELSPAQRLSLEALVHKAASPLPEQRHANSEALGLDLRAWLAGESHSALTLTPMPIPNSGPVPLDEPVPTEDAPGGMAWFWRFWRQLTAGTPR